MIPIFAVSQDVVIALAGAALLAAVGVLGAWLPKLRRVGRAMAATHAGSTAPGGIPGDAPAPGGVAAAAGVSVVVYTCGNAEGLATLIASLRAQEYAGPWEVVVVNDGHDPEVDDFLTIAGSNAGEWLRSTFTPRDARSSGRKKLALTLAIKAARFPAVLLLTSASRLPGPGWLRAMAAPLTAGSADIVVGYAGPCRGDCARPGLLGRRLRHQMLIDDLLWLADALARRPWRGDGDNMGMRRSIFFDQSGFGNSLDLAYGDDDVFISDAATRSNTAVVLAAPARVATEAPADAPAFYRTKRERHALMGRWCRRRPALRHALAALMPWAWLAATVAAAALILTALPGLAPADSAGARPLLMMLGGVALVALLLWTALGVAFNRVSMALTGRHMRWTALGALLARPLHRRPRRPARAWSQPL